MKNKYKLPIILKLLLINIFFIILFSSITIMFSFFNIKYYYNLIVCTFIILLLTYINFHLIIKDIKNMDMILNNYINKEYSYKCSYSSNKESSLMMEKINQIGDILESNDIQIITTSFELEKLNKKYINEEEYKKNLVASISHEIKTPLSVITSISMAILDGIIDEKDIKKEIQNILVESEKTTKMLQEIVNVYKMDSNILQFDYKNERIDLIINDVIENLKIIAIKHNINIVSNVNIEFSYKVDYIRIKQAFNNIILNAITHSISSSTVYINLDRKNDYILFEVINTNSNINKDELKYIFEPFYRVDKARTKKDDVGNGLGLYIVKEILSKHNLDYGIYNTDDSVKFYIIFK